MSESYAKAFNLSDDQEVVELFDELDAEDAFEVCKANKALWGALSGQVRSHIFRLKICPPPPAFKEPEVQSKALPFDALIYLFAKDYLSKNPGFRRSEHTRNKVQRRNGRIAHFLELYSKALPEIGVGSSKKYRNEEALIPIFANALKMSHATIARKWDERSKLSTKKRT